jgi:hypothetical protein
VRVFKSLGDRPLAHRWLAAVTAAVVVGAGGVLTLASPAAAAFAGLVNTSWAYTDVREPNDIHLDPSGDLPVGAWREGEDGLHSSRAYFTFDVSEFQGRHIYQAVVALTETEATDCANRQLEVWATGDVDESTSWVHPPERLSLLEPDEGHEAEPCPAFGISWTAVQALQAAATAGATTFTVEASVPVQHMADVELGRRLSSQAFLSVEYETLPLPRPLVSSPDYPESFEFVFGAGIPGEFTFDAQGNAGAVGFQYRWFPDLFGVGDPFADPQFVPADEPDGGATLMLAPPLPFLNILSVRSVNAAGLTGGVTEYRILVRDTAPFVTWDQAGVEVGVPFEITFTPVLDGAAEFRYRVEAVGNPEGPEVTVPAGPDGTAATFITVPEPNLYFIHARMVHQDGWTSPFSTFLLVVF